MRPHQPKKVLTRAIQPHRGLKGFLAQAEKLGFQVTPKDELEQELAKYKRPKDLAGRVSEEWIIRVILTAPNVSARALSESFRMTVGEDHNVISRTQVGRIRAAFLELWKDMLYSSVRSFIDLRANAIALSAA